MPQDALVDPIPADVAEFVEFFQESLAELEFPDVDLATLGTLADTVRVRALELAHLSEQVRAARQALEQAQEELAGRARRGLAYIKVYAEGDSALTREIAELTLGRDPSDNRQPKKRQGRARSKAAGESRSAKGSDEPTGELPFQESSSEAA